MVTNSKPWNGSADLERFVCGPTSALVIHRWRGRLQVAAQLGGAIETTKRWSGAAASLSEADLRDSNQPGFAGVTSVRFRSWSCNKKDWGQSPSLDPSHEVQTIAIVVTSLFALSII